MLMGNRAPCDNPDATKPACTRNDSQLGLGDVNGDGRGEIAIGLPRATVAGKAAAGTVALIPAPPRARTSPLPGSSPRTASPHPARRLR
ncbi:FG-GAP repeat protein [Nonomuraea pusilla]|uniref:FG-GAP repeat protein n=1 Tax=Nonomuraea pusilla TaxID=46177 RepID=UPI00116028DB